MALTCSFRRGLVHLKTARVLLLAVHVEEEEPHPTSMSVLLPPTTQGTQHRDTSHISPVDLVTMKHITSCSEAIRIPKPQTSQSILREPLSSLIGWPSISMRKQCLRGQEVLKRQYEHLRVAASRRPADEAHGTQQESRPARSARRLPRPLEQRLYHIARGCTSDCESKELSPEM